MIGIQKIFQAMQDEDRIDQSVLNKKQKKVLKDILECKTEIRGFNKDVCESCGHTEIHYNSCRNVSCPNCQAYNREVWIHKESRLTLNTNYFHVVFTIPSELNALVLADAKTLYTILFQSVSDTLKELSSDKKYLGASIGFTAVLHTWGQNLSLHPHIHCIIPGGGLDTLKRWKSSRKKFFLPVKVLSEVFRGKFLDKLKKKLDKSKLTDQKEFQKLIDICYEKDWVVYTKKPMKSAKHVIRYLGRYTHRIAISNARILKYENNQVTFKYKDYKDKNKVKEMTLDDTEFFRRFMLHVLPKGFMKIRHYGFLSNCNREERMTILRTSTQTPNIPPLEINSEEIISKIIKRDVSICIACGQKRHPQLE